MQGPGRGGQGSPLPSLGAYGQMTSAGLPTLPPLPSSYPSSSGPSLPPLPPAQGLPPRPGGTWGPTPLPLPSIPEMQQPGLPPLMPLGSQQLGNPPFPGLPPLPGPPGLPGLPPLAPMSMPGPYQSQAQALPPLPPMAPGMAAPYAPYNPEDPRLPSRASSLASQLPLQPPQPSTDPPPDPSTAAPLELDWRAGALQQATRGSQAAGVGAAKTFVEDYATGEFFESIPGSKGALRRVRRRRRRRLCGPGGAAAEDSDSGDGEAPAQSELVPARDLAKSVFRQAMMLGTIVVGVLAGISLVFLVGIVVQEQDLADGVADGFLTYWGRSLEPLNAVFHWLLSSALAHAWFLLSCERRSSTGDGSTKRQRLWVLLVIYAVGFGANVAMAFVEQRMTFAARRYELVTYVQTDVRLISAAQDVPTITTQAMVPHVAADYRGNLSLWHAGNVIRCSAALIAWIFCVYIVYR